MFLNNLKKRSLHSTSGWSMCEILNLCDFSGFKIIKMVKKRIKYHFKCHQFTIV